MENPWDHLCPVSRSSPAPSFVLPSPVCCRASGPSISNFSFQVTYFCFVFVDVFSLKCNRHTEKGTDHQCTSEWVFPKCTYPRHHYPDQELVGADPASRHPSSHMSPSPVTSPSPQLNTILNPVKVTHSLCLSRGFMSVKSSHWWNLVSLSQHYVGEICLSCKVFVYFHCCIISVVRTHQFVYLFYYWVFGVFLFWRMLQVLVHVLLDTCTYVLLSVYT